MRALIAEADSQPSRRRPVPLDQATVTLGARPIRFSLVELDDPGFDAAAEENRDQVQVRIRGFSLNYRDRGLVLRSVGAAAEAPAVGSEFVGEVLQTGSGVRGLRVGQRVMAQMAWPSKGVPGLAGGIPTNAASVEIQPFHAANLVAVPDGMPDETAAGFVLGAQTAFGIAGRLEPGPDRKVLVTAATSNTGLLAIRALVARGIGRVYAVTTRKGAAGRLRAVGAGEVFELESRADDFAAVRRVAQAIGGFDGAVDPFADVYLARVVGVLGFFGRYVTCGLAEQGGGESVVAGLPQVPLGDVLAAIIVRNIAIVGNCLGRREDLDAALDAWGAGRFPVEIDSVHSGAQVASFIERTYLAGDRLGKVIYLYS